MSATTDHVGEISRRPIDIKGTTGLSILARIGSPLCNELERVWLSSLYDEASHDSLFFEEDYTGRVVDWFVGDGVDTPVRWSYQDRIEWHLVDVDTAVSKQQPWWKTHKQEWEWPEGQWEWPADSFDKFVTSKETR